MDMSESAIREILRDFFEDQGVEVSIREVDDLLSDLRSVDTGGTLPAGPTAVDAIAALCNDGAIPVDERDGLLLIKFTPTNEVVPYVLRLGLMTEGRLETAMMRIYTAIVQARGRAVNQMRKEANVPA